MKERRCTHMYFSSLTLRQFRNYASLTLRPSQGTTVIYGGNGAGKTNVLEAMHLLSLGRSHRASSDKEMIADGESVAFARGETQRQDGKHDIEVRLFAEEKPHKRVMLFGKPAERISDMMGHATCVMFSPEDIRIVRDGPAVRRRFMDMQLSQIRPGYLKALKTYLSILERRNALLKAHRQSPLVNFETQLDTWDDQLAAASVSVVEMRRWFLAGLSQNASAQYAAIAEDDEETFSLQYTGPLAHSEEPQKQMFAGLQRARREDMQRLYTTFGPHRDDMSLLLCGKELRTFGSQGQLRTAVLSMKLGELSFIHQELGEFPTLLLDDVFSELDSKRRNALLGSAAGAQTLITCTEKQDAAGARADAYLRVVQGKDGHAEITDG